MKTMRILFAIAIMGLFTACSDSGQQASKSVSPIDELYGLASPIRLNPELTVVNLNDYFPDSKVIKVESPDSNLIASLDTSQKLVHLTGSSFKQDLRLNSTDREWQSPICDPSFCQLKGQVQILLQVFKSRG